MKTLRVNDCDMPYVDIGTGAPIVCVHGSTSDFRTWGPVMGPLSKNNRLIVPSLRHYFPEQFDGKAATFNIAQHVEDVIAFIEALNLGPVDLVGHSRGGHISFRLALKRPDLIRKLVLAEPGGVLDPSLAPAPTDGSAPAAAGSRGHVNSAAELIAAGDVDGGLRLFREGIDGPGAWEALSEVDKQTRRDNAMTLVAQVNEGRQPYTRAEAEAISLPTLLVMGANTPGVLPVTARTMAATIPGAQLFVVPDAKHGMFAAQPPIFCKAVLGFLAG